MKKEATKDDAVKLAQKLNLNKESVWKILEGKKFSGLNEMAMAVQQAFTVPAPAQR
jgi:hypothetical protein